MKPNFARIGKLAIALRVIVSINSEVTLTVAMAEAAKRVGTDPMAIIQATTQ